MAHFGYTSTNELSPNGHNKFATTYYKQSLPERKRTLQHIKAAIEHLADICIENHGSLDVLLEPMPGFKKSTDKPNYSAAEVIQDLHDYMESGKDIPSGMLGRWNRLFADTGFTIDLVPAAEMQLHTSTFRRLFK